MNKGLHQLKKVVDSGFRCIVCLFFFNRLLTLTRLWLTVLQSCFYARRLSYRTHKLRMGRQAGTWALLSEHSCPVSCPHLTSVVQVWSHFKPCSHSHSGSCVLIISSPQESFSWSTPAFPIWWFTQKFSILYC